MLEYYSHGKLLITGEYFALKGADCLALPLQFGQKMNIFPSKKKNAQLIWKSYHKNRLWFEATFNRITLEVLSTNDNSRAQFISNILLKAAELNTEAIINKNSIELIHHLEFHPEWGLGSSSTLISNIAFWLNINPYALLNKTSGGSGYDVACAREDGPLLYTLKEKQPQIATISFKPSFSGSIYFVYLGRKVSSMESIRKNAVYIENHSEKIETISNITRKIVASSNLKEFESLVSHHEEIMAEVLQEETVKRKLFSDFPGTVKSLGAWGGDFIMVTTTKGRLFLEDYFKAAGLNIIFNYNDLVL